MIEVYLRRRNRASCRPATRYREDRNRGPRNFRPATNCVSASIAYRFPRTPASNGFRRYHVGACG